MIPRQTTSVPLLYISSNSLVLFFRFALASNTGTSRSREERPIQIRCAAPPRRTPHRDRRYHASTPTARLPRRRVVRPPLRRRRHLLPHARRDRRPTPHKAHAPPRRAPHRTHARPLPRARRRRCGPVGRQRRRGEPLLSPDAHHFSFLFWMRYSRTRHRRSSCVARRHT